MSTTHHPLALGIRRMVIHAVHGSREKHQGDFPQAVFLPPPIFADFLASFRPEECYGLADRDEIRFHGIPIRRHRQPVSLIQHSDGTLEEL